MNDGDEQESLYNRLFSFTMIRMGRKLSCMDQSLKSKRSSCPENQSYEEFWKLQTLYL